MTTDASPKLFSPRNLLYMGIAALALAVIGYGAGRLQGGLALRAATQAHQEERAALKQRIAAAATQATVCHTDRDLLRARRSLSLVSLALERRNFGIAEERRRELEKELSSPALATIAAISDLKQGVEALHLAVDPDPGAKRNDVIALIDQLDEIILKR